MRLKTGRVNLRCEKCGRRVHFCEMKKRFQPEMVVAADDTSRSSARSAIFVENRLQMIFLAPSGAGIFGQWQTLTPSICARRVCCRRPAELDRRGTPQRTAKVYDGNHLRPEAEA